MARVLRGDMEWEELLSFLEKAGFSFADDYNHDFIK